MISSTHIPSTHQPIKPSHPITATFMNTWCPVLVYLFSFNSCHSKMLTENKPAIEPLAPPHQETLTVNPTGFFSFGSLIRKHPKTPNWESLERSERRQVHDPSGLATPWLLAVKVGRLECNPAAGGQRAVRLSIYTLYTDHCPITKDICIQNRLFTHVWNANMFRWRSKY